MDTRKKTSDASGGSYPTKSVADGLMKFLTWGKNKKKKKKKEAEEDDCCCGSEMYQRSEKPPFRRNLDAYNGLIQPEYDMSHESRGKVYIFNHSNFKRTVEPREGTEKDVENLMQALPKLGFRRSDINLFEDLTVSEIDDKLEEISQDDHSKRDMLMIFVLTHGEVDGKIYAYDADYNVQRLWKYFTGEKCETLKGKPKVFFIMACRGSQYDDGTRIKLSAKERKLSITETDSAACQPTVSYTIPVWADFLTVYSTMEGFLSYRNPQDGTWYVQSFCQELRNYAEPKLHFFDFLTAVNKKVATVYQTLTPHRDLNNKKQCPFVTSSLIKILSVDIPENGARASDDRRIRERPKSMR